MKREKSNGENDKKKAIHNFLQVKIDHQAREKRSGNRLTKLKREPNRMEINRLDLDEVAIRENKMGCFLAVH